MLTTLAAVWATTIAWLTANLILALTIYVVGGIVYSFLKWIVCLFQLRSKVNNISEETIKERMKSYGSSVAKTREEAIDYERASIANKYFEGYGYPPKAKDNVGKITTWAIFWPFNLIWTLFADVTVLIWEFVAKRIEFIYQAVVKAILPK